ncbi:hypothetical protein M5689_003183 [Euphorbia peplus]|nr:hypothetical protein M5689_003183 [Euphorbia peplus]
MDNPLQNFPFDWNNTPEDTNCSYHSNSDTPTPNVHGGTKRKNITKDKKIAIIEELVKESRNGRVPTKVIEEVASIFSVSKRTVYKVWHAAKFLIHGLRDSSPSVVKKVGRHRKNINFELVKNISLSKRTNIRSLSKALGEPKSTVHRRIKEGSLRPHSNALKPYLTNENKIARLEFCLSMIDKGTIETKPSFIDMYDRIHIDEKWFNITKIAQKYYLHPDEKGPLRTCKSKRFIIKIMFLAAVARPRINNSSNGFDGKIGIWPFVY